MIWIPGNTISMSDLWLTVVNNEISALSTKLAELAFMRNSTGDEPVLSLDDVFSELRFYGRVVSATSGATA